MLAGIPALRRCDVPSYQTGVATTEYQRLPILQQQYVMMVRRVCDVVSGSNNQGVLAGVRGASQPALQIALSCRAAISLSSLHLGMFSNELTAPDGDSCSPCRPHH